MGYAHLHLHTQYSLLDGANKISNLMPKLSRLGMQAAAITDHGNMFGAVDFYRSAVTAGVKPIIGCEVYVAPRSRRDRSSAVANDYERGGNYHLILLAMNHDGYRNLSRMVSQSYIDGFYYKPRIDKELLRDLNDGIICLSGCLGGEVANAVVANRDDVAQAVVDEYAGIFGDRYYLEIQDNRLEAQQKVNAFLVEVSKKKGIPLVATNDCHYLEHEDHEAHEALLCVQTGKRLSDTDRWKFETDQLFVKTADEMLEAFRHCPEAVGASVDIAQRCKLELEFGTHQFPVYQPPEGETLVEHFLHAAEEGLESRLLVLRKKYGKVDENAYRQRLRDELECIVDMDFPGYFLIVADFINWAKSRGIPVGPGRGSAAGSLVSYALRITDVDPIRYTLIFERFLNPERRSMPDIDVDFCYERRDEVLQYVREKYGKDHVAHIITFGTLKGKAAIRDVGRVLDFSFTETDKICKLYPAPKQGRDFTLEQALSMEPRLRELRDSGQREGKLFDYALKLEGLARHVSKHAAGIVISNEPLVESVPLFMDKDGAIMTQYAGPDVEALGLIKFDFLGLKTLTMLADTVRRIRESHGKAIELEDIPLDDPAAYRLTSQADTVGIFQMESGGMRNLLTKIKPSCFEDLIAILALFRPGPLDSGMVEQFIKRRDGKEPVRYPDRTLEEILSETHGVIVYQEQVMQIAQVYAGYSMGDADKLRRAMGKKKAEAMAIEKERFVAGAVARGHRRSSAELIFQQMETFAAYGFNKSHSAAYALISYQTAWLKAHYPCEFLAALLSLEMGDTEKTYKNLNDCRQHGIRVLEPDVNSSRADFTVVGKDIRFGLAAVKGVGGKAVENIISARDEGGPFKSFADFCSRVSGPQVNKRIVEGLIKGGAFDTLESSRSALCEGLEATLAWAQRVAADRDAGQMGLFAAGSQSTQPEPQLPQVEQWDTLRRLQAEHDTVGFYISGHPLDRHLNDLKLLGTVNSEELRAMREGSTVRVAGVTNTLRLKNSRKGERYATFFLEDKEGITEVIAWPRVYRQYEEAIVGKAPIYLSGTLEFTGDSAAPELAEDDGFSRKPQIIADEIVELAEMRRRAARYVDITIETGSFAPPRLEDLKTTLARFPGNCRSYLRVVKPGASETVIELPTQFNVDPCDGFLAAVDELLGPGRAQIR
ncbi:MAG: DNA polymerase III subunit alpha [Candidatus Binatia bacterium]